MLRVLPTFLLLLSLVLACGKEDTPKSVSQALAGTSWKGTFKRLLENKKFDEPEKVSLTLMSSSRFTIESLNQVSTQAGGTYTDFPRNKSLIFEIESSNYSLVGNQGTTQDFTYDFGEDELKLSGQSGEYLMAKVKDDSEADAESGSSQQSGVTGDWRCISDAASAASIEINLSKASFRGRKIENTKKTVFFEGSTIEESKPEAEEISLLLQIKSASVESLKGNELRLKSMRESTKAVLIQLDVQKQETGSLNCQKQ